MGPFPRLLEAVEKVHAVFKNGGRKQSQSNLCLRLAVHSAITSVLHEPTSDIDNDFWKPITAWATQLSEDLHTHLVTKFVEILADKASAETKVKNISVYQSSCPKLTKLISVATVIAQPPAIISEEIPNIPTPEAMLRGLKAHALLSPVAEELASFCGAHASSLSDTCVKDVEKFLSSFPVAFTKFGEDAKAPLEKTSKMTEKYKHLGLDYCALLGSLFQGPYSSRRFEYNLTITVQLDG